jgi:predicted ArsR family transcriptional regulator
MQLSIDFNAPVYPVARRTNPHTSHAAAHLAKALAQDHQRTILACLEAHGPLGKDGIGARTQLTGHQVGKRLPELQRLGLVQPTGRTVASESGRQEREWRRV